MASPNTNRSQSKKYCDLYNTPVEGLERLINKVDFDPSKSYFEPCAGKGAVSEFFLDRLKIAMTTNELEDHGYSTDYNVDFLSGSGNWYFDYIVTNPPYKLAKEFIIEGFKHSKEQYHLLRLDFLNSQNRHKDLFTLGHLKTVYVFVSRISCSKGVEEEPQANAVVYAWFHFDRDYNGLPTVDWI